MRNLLVITFAISFSNTTFAKTQVNDSTLKEKIADKITQAIVNKCKLDDSTSRKLYDHLIKHQLLYWDCIKKSTEYNLGCRMIYEEMKAVLRRKFGDSIYKEFIRINELVHVVRKKSRKLEAKRSE